VDRPDIALFSESSGRFVLEVATEDQTALREIFAGLPCAPIGRVLEDPVLHMVWFAGEPVLRLGTDALQRAWRGTGD
jgi:phosphoribosylformylglycinamidine synthase subunit PurSL